MKYRVFNSIKIIEGAIYKNRGNDNSYLKYIQIVKVPPEDNNNSHTVIYKAFASEANFMARKPNPNGYTDLSSIARWIRENYAIIVPYNFNITLINRDR
tara:strand:- start:342 stop:638 length:297 start_codon:yes stop_codon:yes gene_type:complete